MVREKSQKKYDLVKTSELDKHKLVYNLKWNLIICSLCCEGLSLRSVSTHLLAQSLKHWDKMEGKEVKYETGHLPYPEFNQIPAHLDLW